MTTVEAIRKLQRLARDKRLSIVRLRSEWHVHITMPDYECFAGHGKSLPIAAQRALKEYNR